jgi:hypothetical protein
MLQHMLSQFINSEMKEMLKRFLPETLIWQHKWTISRTKSTLITLRATAAFLQIYYRSLQGDLQIHAVLGIEFYSLYQATNFL